MNQQEIEAQIKSLMKKYKMTLYGMVFLIALYLVFLFWIKIPYVVLIICVPMILLAIYNSRLAKQIRKLTDERAKAIRQAKIDAGELDENAPEASAVVEDAKSLNDLPKEYTVLDEVEVDGILIEHVVLSPYGAAVIGSEEDGEKVRGAVSEMGLPQTPVFVYAPSEDTAVLVTEIQTEKNAVLTEQEIMQILYKLSGLK